MTTQSDLFRGDFDGNGTGDLFLFTDKGDNAIWLMNQNQRLGTGANLPSNGPTWHAKAFADFAGGDPFSADILWQNDNGALALWQINRTTIQHATNLPNPGQSWHAVQANDFDNNGAADILLQNDNGALAIWAFHAGPNGPELLPGGAGQFNIDQNPGPSWHAVATGDTNSDHTAGIVFQNDSGALALWESTGVDGGVIRASDPHFNIQVNLPNPGAGWHARFMGDFNGDNRADLLLQNDNGAVAIWTFGGSQGTTVVGAFNVAGTQNNGAAWHVVAVQDQNGDGRADIVWQHDNGASAVWENFVASGANAVFATQLDINPNPNAGGHLDWPIV